jgi:hypothetical protein
MIGIQIINIYLMIYYKYLLLNNKKQDIDIVINEKIIKSRHSNINDKLKFEKIKKYCVDQIKINFIKIINIIKKQKNEKIIVLKMSIYII